MFRTKDTALLVVQFASVTVGVMFPDAGVPFQAHLTLYLMGLLFLSFLGIRPAEFLEVFKGAWKDVSLLTATKLVILPVVVYTVFTFISPDYALAALLLSGISSGVVAPFMCSLIGGRTALALAVVVATSLLSPFTLPVLVKMLAGRNLAIPLGPMVKMLALVVFVPMVVGEIYKKLLPKAADWTKAKGFPLSLILFTCINLGVFSKYSAFFRAEPHVLLTALTTAIILGCVFVMTGLLVQHHRPVEDRVAAANAMANMNNVLVIVFGSKFFGPLEPTLAAVYLVPFFGLILPLRMYMNWNRRKWTSPRRIKADG